MINIAGRVCHRQLIFPCIAAAFKLSRSGAKVWRLCRYLTLPAPFMTAASVRTFRTKP